MTGTLQPVLFLGEVHCTGQMRAFLAVGHKSILSCANHDARIFRRGVREQFRFSNRKIVHSDNLLWCEGWRAGEPAPDQNPNIPNEHSQTRQNEELRKLPPRHILFVSALDREFIAPQWLFRGCCPLHPCVSHMKSVISTSTESA